MAGKQPHQRGYGWFTAGVASWFGAFGMQQVIFSWIIVGELQASSETVGLVQTTNMLPSLLLLMVGGAVADRVDPRRLLIGIHVLATLPVLGLSVALVTGNIQLPVVIGFGLLIGTVSAFALPARDALLSRVAGDDMMRAVTGLTAAQFGSQAAGSLVAGLSSWFGSAMMLLVQACVLLVGVFFATRLPSAAPHGSHDLTTPRPSPLREITQGLRIVARVSELRAPVTLVIAVGVLFIGPFLVVFPLLVRDVYNGGPDLLAIVLMLFPLGTITGSLVLRRVGLPHKGRAALLALLGGSAPLIVIGLGVPFWAMVVLTFIWGVCGSVFINCSRTLYQEAAPAAERGRVLAIYQLGFMGGAPIGATAAGILGGIIGLQATLVVFATAMAILVGVMAVASRLPRMP